MCWQTKYFTCEYISSASNEQAALYIYLHISTETFCQRKITKTASKATTVLKIQEISCIDLAKFISEDSEVDARQSAHLALSERPFLLCRNGGGQRMRQPWKDSVFIWIQHVKERESRMGWSTWLSEKKRGREVSYEACEPNPCVYQLQTDIRLIWGLMI